MDAPAEPSDLDVRDRIVAGAAAVASLQQRFRKPLEAFLVGQCDRADGRSREKAVEIVHQVLADCFVKSPSLLERWQGPDNLQAFLRTVAMNRLRSWWESAENRRTTVDSGLVAESAGAALPAGAEEEGVRLAGRALRGALELVARSRPEGLVFMRLKGLHGVDQRAMARCWACHEAQVSRRIKEAMDTIRTEAGRVLEAAGEPLAFADLQAAIGRHPDLLLGTPGESCPVDEFAALRELAAGRAGADARARLAGLLCRSPEAVAYLAQLLAGGEKPDAVVAKDAHLAGIGARILQAARRSLDAMPPREYATLLTPAAIDQFRTLLALAGADGGTLWVLCRDAAALEAVFNPLEPELAGKRQPLASGIVSLALATGEAMSVADASAHERHSPAIDQALGKTTRAMTAVPVALAGATRGVLTAVRLLSENPFDAREVGLIRTLADTLAVHMEYRLAQLVCA
jgi:DNA-directed RNA polymerase specialized sigma24 family protein